MLESFFIWQPATLLKKRLWHRCFPVNFAKVLRTIFTEHLRWLLLSVNVRDVFRNLPNIFDGTFLKKCLTVNCFCKKVDIWQGSEYAYEYGQIVPRNRCIINIFSRIGYSEYLVQVVNHLMHIVLKWLDT